MRQKIKILFSVLSLIFIVTISSCNIVGDAVGDCIITSGPVLPDKSLVTGTLQVPYLETIQASIKRDPNDDDYIYNFDISGRLPYGITYTQNSIREISFYGTPLERGAFTIEITVSVTPVNNGNYGSGNTGDYDDGDTLCFTTVTREYTIYID